MNIRIVALINKVNIGDDNNAIAIAEKLKDIMIKIKVPVDNIILLNLNDSLSLSNWTKEINNFLEYSDNKFIIVGAGEDKLKLLDKLKNDVKYSNDIWTVWSGHQLPNFFTSSLKIDKIALPTHVVTKELRKVLGNRLIETIGVPSNIDYTALSQAYQDMISNVTKDSLLLRNEDSTILKIVLLGGDAPDENSKINFYSPEESYKLASYISKNHDGSHTLVTNGPRTGKYDPITQKERTSHNTIDPVSKVFVDTLQSSKQKYEFFDYKGGHKNAYKAMLHAGLKVGFDSKKKVELIIPGESVSSISEILQYKKNFSHENIKIIAFETNSMNRSHYNFITDLFKRGHISILNKEMNLIDYQEKARKNIPSPALTVAQTIFFDFLKREMSSSQDQQSKTNLTKSTSWTDLIKAENIQGQNFSKD